jgi:hypothetical protein
VDGFWAHPFDLQNLGENSKPKKTRYRTRYLKKKSIISLLKLKPSEIENTPFHFIPKKHITFTLLQTQKKKYKKYNTPYRRDIKILII